MKAKNTWLDAIKKTKDRTPMPRPAVFKDKSKYDRKRRKSEDRSNLIMYI